MVTHLVLMRGAGVGGRTAAGHILQRSLSAAYGAPVEAAQVHGQQVVLWG